MKNLGIFLLIFNFSLCFTQTKIQFKDGTTFSFEAEKIGIKTEIQDGVFTKTIHYYYNIKGTAIQIYESKVLASGKINEIKIYTLNINQLDKNSFSEVYEQEADEYTQKTTFRLPFSCQLDSGFDYEVYDFWSSTPEKKNFNTFTVVSENREDLELFRSKILSLFPPETIEE